LQDFKRIIEVYVFSLPVAVVTVTGVADHSGFPWNCLKTVAGTGVAGYSGFPLNALKTRANGGEKMMMVKMNWVCIYIYFLDPIVQSEKI
jgi:hypothetical protein